jgi:hypothetical protein
LEGNSNESRSGENFWGRPWLFTSCRAAAADDFENDANSSLSVVGNKSAD